MQHRSITTDRQLAEYCRQLAQADSIALDTEFVSEHTFRPVLCLVQVAASGEIAVIDAMAVEDVTPFWEAVTAEGHETVVHAGRSEMEFCLEATGRWPERPFDVQLAAGLAGGEYPAGYNNLLAQLLGEKPRKHETRTDWRRRPLSKRQIEYAIDDARYLPALRDTLHAKLEQLGRLAWLDEEMAAWREEVECACSKDRWRRIPGISGLDRQSLAIVRELFYWREGEAERRNRPVRRVLRDDLIVELARRKTADQKRILAIRGLGRRDLRSRMPEIAARIRHTLDLPDDDRPAIIHRERTPRISVLGQFLFSALGSVCRRSQLAPNLVGTPNDIRDLIVYRTGGSKRERVPRLAQGWRAEFIGHLFDDLLAGKKSIRIEDPKSEHPLIFEPADS